MAGEADALFEMGPQRTVDLCPYSLGLCGVGHRALPLDTRWGIFTFVKIIDPDARRAAVTLLRRGTITVSEAAVLAGVSRQVVRYWCKAGHVIIGQSRAVAVAKAWRRALNRRSQE